MNAHAPECSRTQIKGGLSRFADMQLQLNYSTLAILLWGPRYQIQLYHVQQGASEYGYYMHMSHNNN